MHYDKDRNKYIISPNQCQPLCISLSRELHALIKVLKPDSLTRVELQVDDHEREKALKETRGVLNYWGYSMLVIPGTKDIEVRT